MATEFCTAHQKKCVKSRPKKVCAKKQAQKSVPKKHAPITSPHSRTHPRSCPLPCPHMSCPFVWHIQTISISSISISAYLYILLFTFSYLCNFEQLYFLALSHSFPDFLRLPQISSTYSTLSHSSSYSHTFIISSDLSTISQTFSLFMFIILSGALCIS